MGDVMRDLREFWQHSGGPMHDPGQPVMLTFWHPGHDCPAATVYGPTQQVAKPADLNLEPDVRCETCGVQYLREISADEIGPLTP